MDPFGDPDQDHSNVTTAAAVGPEAAIDGSPTHHKVDSPFVEEEGHDQAPAAATPPSAVAQDSLDPLTASALASASAPHARYRDGFDEPPASVMLDIDGGTGTPRASAGATRRSETSAPSSRGGRFKASIFEQSRIPDEPQAEHASSHRDRRGSTADDDDDDIDDPDGLYSDEEAALMAREERRRGYPQSSSSGRRSKGRSRRQRADGTTYEDGSASSSRHRGSSSSRSGRSERSKKARGWRWTSALPSTAPQSRRTALRGLDPKQKALWMWANVDNMDAFLQEVYSYYVGKGAVCIALSRALNLLTIAFVIGFSTFLLGCVDYSSIRHDGRLSEVIVDHCVSRFSNLALVLLVSFVAFFGWQVLQFGFGLSRLAAMHRFYTHLLNIPDADVQSIPWNEVVNRIATLREEHPITSLSSQAEGNADDGAGRPSEKLDAHDVANRIMRQENYLIALFNKDTLDLSIPGLRHRSPALTRSLEWNLNFCLLGFLFDSRGQVRRQFLTDRHRGQLIEGLRRRFVFMAIVNAVFAPFIVLYLLLYSFFRYFEEYHKDPSNLGSRQYTQYARWKFREYNELPHLFRRRCHSSYPYAQRYIDQFPKEKTAVVARFVAFIAGSFTAVLLLASVIDPDLFLHFDITPQRNVLFYVGVFGAVLAFARGMIPDEHLVFEPEVLLRAVIHHTHYMAEGWKGRFHSADVHAEFGRLYTLKIYIFFQELLSVITTPFVLWLSLPRSAPAIIDFFREFTVHVDGVGYVCSFAVFSFRRDGVAADEATSGGGGGVGGGGGRAGVPESRRAKMEQSMLGFKANHPDWEPTDPASSLFLSRMAAMGSDGGALPAGHWLGDDGRPAREGRYTDRGRGAAAGAGGGGGGGGGFEGLRGASRAAADAAEVGGKPFTPINSTLLATRSQFYEDAFTRSIALARDKDNAAALAASAHNQGRSAGSNKHPPRSRSKGRGRAHNDSTYSSRIVEVDEEDDGDDDAGVGRSRANNGRAGLEAHGSFEGVDPVRGGGGGGRGMDQSHFDATSAGQTGVRDLLHHISTGRGTPGGARW
ncbi:uncharacterized protein PFL1_05637 [Pseudozyma flocculosa PF-1]|uniref:Autophagy-related protein 9 n=2 Tax=Pseudozyma flocculosa TaxID=84751 RepID=A0A5C3FCV2_9BASI|nr:uncharacterized protein PFL1_05637 [Pseudozyma flocculosa PF-1]EPQ26657.1 hypothetical protein PFL1_05637 [Pseudozyma flocculosa PF-1]SPO42178.1 related to ATG9 - integral membrane protein required for Cvt and autophagy transport [Pseudozyma flocculosa]